MRCGDHLVLPLSGYHPFHMAGDIRGGKGEGGGGKMEKGDALSFESKVYMVTSQPPKSLKYHHYHQE